jgi:hypothetical protein
MNFGARCNRFKRVMTASGPAMRCSNFGEGDFGDDFGLGEARDHIAGPLIGGGVAQVGTLATRLLFKDSPLLQKYAPIIGTALGAAASGAMMLSPRFKSTGISGIITAALVGIPRQIEDLLMGSAMKDYLGVITAEQEMAGYGLGDEYAGYGFGDEYAGLGAQQQDIQLLDGGGGLGVITAEQEMNGPADIEMLGGSSGFGANFLASQ